MKTIIIAPSFAAGVEACKEIGVGPWDRYTCIATPRVASWRNFQLGVGDRIFEHVSVASSPACRQIIAFFKTLALQAGDLKPEWKVIGDPELWS